MDASDVLRGPLLQLSKSHRVRDVIVKAPVSGQVVARFVPGPEPDDAVRAASELRRTGRLTTIDYLGEDTLDAAEASRKRDAYVDILQRLSDEGLTADGKAEVSLKLSALGQALPADGDKVALDNARAICVAARNAGTTLTIDMEDHTTTDSTLSVVRELRADFPWVGTVLQAYLKRTEQDCRDLAHEGSRVRLCKGAYEEPASLAFKHKDEVDLAYVRCLKILMAGQGYPMLATHDPRLIDIGRALAGHHGRAADSYELQMLFGIRPTEQVRIADRGQRMRVYVPFGEDWYGYFMRRMAERPANTVFFVRSLLTKG